MYNRINEEKSSDIYFVYMGITYHYMSITRIQPVRRKFHNPIRRTIEEGQIRDPIEYKSLFLGKIIPNMK